MCFSAHKPPVRSILKNNQRFYPVAFRHGDFVDQGLLYYWVKYHKKNVSIIIRDMIEQYVADTRNKDEVVLEGTLYNNEPFQSRNCDCRKDGGNPNMSTDGLAIFKRLLPFRDFVHFSGKKKPWDGWCVLHFYCCR